MSTPRFPILDAGISVRWSLLEPFEPQMKRNHDQSMSHLAGRGGLSAEEALAVIHGLSLHEAFYGLARRWVDEKAARVELLAWVDKRERELGLKELDEARAQVTKLREALQGLLGSYREHLADNFYCDEARAALAETETK